MLIATYQLSLYTIIIIFIYTYKCISFHIHIIIDTAEMEINPHDLVLLVKPQFFINLSLI